MSSRCHGALQIQPGMGASNAATLGDGVSNLLLLYSSAADPVGALAAFGRFSELSEPVGALAVFEC